MTRFTLIFHPAVKKDLRRLNKPAAAYIVREVFPSLITAPHSDSLPLRGKLKGLQKRVVRYGGTSYRIIYRTINSSHTVFVLSVGPRGDFYERLQRRLK